MMHHTHTLLLLLLAPPPASVHSCPLLPTPLPFPPPSPQHTRPTQHHTGKFGLGAKMALIWSKMTTGLPFTISSALRKQDFISRFELDIDIHKWVV